MVRITKTEGRYYMNDNGKVTEITSTIQKKPKGDGYEFKLPENSAKRKYVSVAYVDESLDYEVKEKNSSTEIQKAPRTKLNWTNFVEDDDKEILQAIMARAEAKMMRAELMAQIEAQKKFLDELMAKAEEIDKEEVEA